MTSISRRSAERAAQLVELLRDRRSLLIVMQDNPDPDSIAAAAALRRIANTLTESVCSLAHGGVVGRGENRAMVGYLGLNLRSILEVDPAKFHAVALVDTQPNTGNNGLPADHVPDIVLDHHPLLPQTRAVPFSDVRPKYGAVATILFEYLQALDIVPDPPLATALLYGIRTDTRDLGQEASQADVAAAETLYTLANTRMLSAIQRGSVPRDYFRALALALDGARVYGNCVVAALGDVENPDMMGEMADLFLRLEGAEWALCYGAHDGKLLLSLRTCQNRLGAGDVMRRIIGRIGTGGGHATLAGGQVPLRQGTRAERDRVERQVRQRFLKQAGVKDDRPQRLLS